MPDFKAPGEPAESRDTTGDMGAGIRRSGFPGTPPRTNSTTEAGMSGMPESTKAGYDPGCWVRGPFRAAVEQTRRAMKAPSACGGPEVCSALPCPCAQDATRAAIETFLGELTKERDVYGVRAQSEQILDDLGDELAASR